MLLGGRVRVGGGRCVGESCHLYLSWCALIKTYGSREIAYLAFPLMFVFTGRQISDVCHLLQKQAWLQPAHPGTCRDFLWCKQPLLFSFHTPGAAETPLFYTQAMVSFLCLGIWVFRSTANIPCCENSMCCGVVWCVLRCGDTHSYGNLWAFFRPNLF